MRIPALEVLMLRTVAAISGTHRSEAAVIVGWTKGRGGRTHPSLFHIAIIQQGSPRLTHWFLKEGRWERVYASAIGPTDSFVA